MMAMEAVTRLGEGMELENFMTTHHACVCSYNLLSAGRAFGPPQAARPSSGGQEGISPARNQDRFHNKGCVPWTLHPSMARSVS